MGNDAVDAENRNYEGLRIDKMIFVMDIIVVCVSDIDWLCDCFLLNDVFCYYCDILYNLSLADEIE